MKLFVSPNTPLFQLSSIRAAASPLLVSYVAPHKGISAKTIARWITEILQLAGVDTKTFSQHATRSASAEFLRTERSMSAKAICQLADWSTVSGVYSRFYDRYIA